MVAEILQLKPVSGQVRYRGTLTPPNYNIAKTDVAADLGGKFGEVFNLTSRDLTFNQNTSSAAYLAFRYFISAEANFFRYLDVSVGVDQIEALYVNPPSIAAIRETFVKVWAPVIGISRPKIAQHFFEVSIDSSAEGKSARQFLDQFVSIKLDKPHKLAGRGVVFDVDTESGGRLHINCVDSVNTPDGIFLYFTYTLKKLVTEMESLETILESVFGYYRQVQSMTHVNILEQP